jgi:hypothetical protein
MTPAPTKPPANPDSAFLMILLASAACPSIQIAAFTAATKAIMVTTAAASSAHRACGPERRTSTATRMANGIAANPIRRSAGARLIMSINGGNSGVNTPVSTPPAATGSSPARDERDDVIAWVNIHLYLLFVWELEQLKRIENSS